MLGDGVLAGERALVVGYEVVGAEAAHAVWGCAADVGEEDLTSLVASRILKLVPISDPEHVAVVLVRTTRKIDNSRFVILQGAVKGCLLSFSNIPFPILCTGAVTSNNGKESGRLREDTWRNLSDPCLRVKGYG